MQTDNEKMALVTVKSGKSAPRTQLGELRELLTTIEMRLTKLKDLSPKEALEILSLFDQADQQLTALKKMGGNVSSEETQWESLLMQFHKRGSLFVRQGGGPSALRRARQDHQPDDEHWWWFIDEALAHKRNSKLRRWAIGFLVLAIVLAGASFIYQRFLAPDPAITASYSLQQDAEYALAAGDAQLALENINKALTYTPDDPDLYLMQGIIYLALDEPGSAEESFESAREKSESDELFYANRARFFALAGQPDLAIEDANWVIEANPDMAYAYIYRGQAHEIRGDFALATADYELASEIAERTEQPDVQVVARIHLAQLLQQMAIPTMETP